MMDRLQLVYYSSVRHQKGSLILYIIFKLEFDIEKIIGSFFVVIFFQMELNGRSIICLHKPFAVLPIKKTKAFQHLFLPDFFHFTSNDLNSFFYLCPFLWRFKLETTAKDELHTSQAYFFTFEWIVSCLFRACLVEKLLPQVLQAFSWVWHFMCLVSCFPQENFLLQTPHAFSPQSFSW